MNQNSAFNIAVFPGDGIGVEVMEAALDILRIVQQRVGGFSLHTGEMLPGGAAAYRDTGIALSDEALQQAEAADAILFGAMGLPDVRYPDGTEIAPQLDMRFHFELYAGVRPVKAVPGSTPVLSHPRAGEIDLVIIRESTEGLFASRGKGVVENDEVARDTMVITRRTSQRLFDFSFNLARQRKQQGRPGKVTCVDKANVFASMAFFRKIFDERAQFFPDIGATHHYIDATALDLVRRPWDFDVLVTENMFGDILSDLGAALMGGMGMAPSADIGDRYGLFQPAHGSAPDIAGQGLANPIAMIQSAVMMLDWLAQKHDIAACTDAARLIDRAIDTVLREQRIRPLDLGGRDGTARITASIIEAIGR
jgi:3-isopropylmalate dehydrogenase